MNVDYIKVHIGVRTSGNFVKVNRQEFSRRKCHIKVYTDVSRASVRRCQAIQLRLMRNCPKQVFGTYPK